jgi:hypothetical protein
MNRTLAVAVSLMALTVLKAEDQGGCDSTIVGDPTFDLWCGEQLCAWKLEQGQIRRVSTWHRSDYGVEMVGSAVVISQVAQISSLDTSCLEYRLQVDREDSVNLYMEMDFLDDGKVEHSQPLGGDGYSPETYRLRPPSWFDRVRFIVRKSGDGRAVLAEIKIKKVDVSECAGAKPIALGHLPEGAPCGSGAECDSGRCVETRQWRADVSWTDPRVTGGQTTVCSRCEADADCAASEVCGLRWTDGAKGYLWRGCVTKAERTMGERCAVDAECATGTCCQGVCAECCAVSSGAGSTPCAGGLTCEARDPKTLGKDYGFQILAAQCAPGQHKGAPGAPCLQDDDCAGGSCKGSGELKACFLDGRVCTEDADCVHWPVCLGIGQAGGNCQ